MVVSCVEMRRNDTQRERKPPQPPLVEKEEKLLLLLSSSLGATPCCCYCCCWCCCLDAAAHGSLLLRWTWWARVWTRRCFPHFASMLARWLSMCGLRLVASPASPFSPLRCCLWVSPSRPLSAPPPPGLRPPGTCPTHSHPLHAPFISVCLSVCFALLYLYL